MMDLKSKIRAVENFPKEGISFKDITTLLMDGEAYDYVIDQCIELTKDIEYDVIVGPEARGFLIAAPMSVKTKKGFIPVRKPGKLPAETVSYEYDLEYGSDVLEIHKDAIKPGTKVLIADDLLATGGTVKAVTELIESLGGEVVGLVFLIELTELRGRDLLGDKVIKSILEYDL
jgi:adenine phosphoribosyltransferase